MGIGKVMASIGKRPSCERLACAKYLVPPAPKTTHNVERSFALGLPSMRALNDLMAGSRSPVPGKWLQR